MSGLTLADGMGLQFTGISGTGSNDPAGATTGPDGDSGWIGTNYNGNENHLSGLKAPMNSLIGVFLTSSVPSGSYPSALDFTTAASRDFITLSPALRQPFFIGDGKTSAGVTQTFIVPTGRRDCSSARWTSTNGATTSGSGRCRSASRRSSAWWNRSRHRITGPEGDACLRRPLFCRPDEFKKAENG